MEGDWTTQGGWCHCPLPHRLDNKRPPISLLRMDPTMPDAGGVPPVMRKLQKNCSECTRAHRHCVFSSLCINKCNRCVKMNLQCKLKYSGTSCLLPIITESNILPISFLVSFLFQNKAAEMISCTMTVKVLVL